MEYGKKINLKEITITKKILRGRKEGRIIVNPEGNYDFK